MIIDEADYLNKESFQPAFRNFMDMSTHNCGFILTANYPKKLIEPLRSRLAEIEFNFSAQEKTDMCMDFFRSVCRFLDKENVEFDKKILAKVILKYNPDWRKTINVLQSYAVKRQKIDAGILSNGNIEIAGVLNLMEHIKTKDFTNARKWVGENANQNAVDFFRLLYDHASDFLEPTAIPILIQYIAKYQFQSAFVADQEINTMAFVVDIMMELNGKFK